MTQIQRCGKSMPQSGPACDLTKCARWHDLGL